MASPYDTLYLDGQPVDLPADQGPSFPISYKLEDRFDPQNKTSGDALSIEIPATLNNSRQSNDFSNPSVEDLSTGQAYRNTRDVSFKSKGNTIFHGKALLKSAKHTDRPISYTYDCYGDNANWIIPLKDATLYDFVKRITLTFTDGTVQGSWAFDGTDENLPYVFAPVRYARPMDDYSILVTGRVTKTFIDYDMKTNYFKPSISKYWIIVWALRSQGYRLVSQYMETEWFKRQVMPWTWGGFARLNESRFDVLKFLAQGQTTVTYSNVNLNQFIDVKATNDSVLPGYDNAGNPGSYSYNAGTGGLTWTYLSAYQYGPIEAHFVLTFDITAIVAGSLGSLGVGNGFANMKIDFYWQKNGSTIQIVNVCDLKSSGNRDQVTNPTAVYNLTMNVSPGDFVTGRFHVTSYVDSKSQNAVQIKITSFELAYFQNAQNSAIDFANFTAFKNYKFLDFLAGVFDECDMSIATDPITRTVYMEPTHAYSLTNNPLPTNPGYFNGDFLNWEGKQDLLKEHVLELFSDDNREQVYKYKDDDSDGLLKKVQDRHSITLGQAKYVLPDRFKTERTTVENRFFSPTMHYEVSQWKDFTGTAPWMVVMQPENISNTSQDEAENTFAPKSCYYAGIRTGVSWMYNSATQSGFPTMFAVNYMPGGENDPILSYSDELIGNDTSGYVVGMGLLRRFYLQRLAIMRNGQYYSPTPLLLNNNDVSNVMHREHKIIQNQPWELVEITNYVEDSAAECHLRKHVPVTAEDGANVFPSTGAVQGTVGPSNYDTKYNPLKCFTSDVK